jgi:hypothetical protein
MMDHLLLHRMTFLPHRITLRISWLTLQEVEADLVAEEVTEVEVVGARVVEDAKTKKRSGKQTFLSGIIT